jgi:LacI family transcriptional regulator
MGGDYYMAVTVKQIAELANVSRGTVDRVLNNRSGVSEATRQKVLKIAKELHYEPNFLAKALVSKKESLKIGVILTPDYNPFIHDIISGINRAKKEFSAFGIEVIIKLMTSLDPSEEIRIINDLTENGVSGMAVFPLDHPNVYALLNSLIEKGIAVITFNSPAPEVKSLCFIGQDHYKGGRTAAGLMCKILPKDARIGIIISSTKLSCHQQRLLGFQNKISETRPDIKIVGISENQDKKEDAFRITLEYCNKLPDLDGIYITGGGIAGVGSALDIKLPDLDGIYITGGGIAGVGSALDIIDDSENIHVICHDLTEGSIHLLQTQVVDFVLGQEPVNQGYLLIKTLFEYLVKNITPHKIIDIPVTISTDESYKKEEP